MKKSMKKSIIGLSVLSAIVFTLNYVSAYTADENELLAIIVSDLHYARNGTASDSLVTGTAFADEITDAIVNEVIDKQPKVFIMTGDNTNTGDLRDMTVLAEKLKKIRNAGIQVIMTTGNHDFDKSDMTTYEKCYFSLLDPVDRDSSSLSYTTVSGNTVFLAMDDSSYDLKNKGIFSEETLRWLEEICCNYAAYETIFLSHHNVLAGQEDPLAWSYRIQNDGLPELLQKYGISLCFTGHLHSQMILEDAGLYEVINSMPFGGSHLIGFLESKEEGLYYHTEQIDLEKYGVKALAETLQQKDAEKTEQLKDAIRKILESEGYSGEEKEEIVNLFSRFFSVYYSGEIGNHADELKENKYYSSMIEALWDKNYGPWMNDLLIDPPLDATRLFVPRASREQEAAIWNEMADTIEKESDYQEE